MTVNFEGNEPTSTTAVMQRALRTEGQWRFPCKEPETALDEAWEGEGNCVIRQLAKLYDTPYDVIEKQMMELGDISDGVSADMTLQWCKSTTSKWLHCLE